MQQLLRQIPTYIEKKMLVLYGTQIPYFNPVIFWLEHLHLVGSMVKHIHFQDHRQEINALQ